MISQSGKCRYTCMQTSEASVKKKMLWSEPCGYSIVQKNFFLFDYRLLSLLIEDTIFLHRILKRKHLWILDRSKKKFIR